MLSLSQHATLQNIKDSSLGIERHDMPQIFTKNMDDFKKFLYDNEISFFETVIHPSQLKPSQNEFSTDKIEHLIDNPKDSQIITSSDKYVVDGHHRWAAALLDGSPFVKCVEIFLPINELLTKLHSYDKVGYKSVDEQLI